MNTLTLFSVFFIFSASVNAIIFDLPTGRYKCIIEEVRQVLLFFIDSLLC